MISSASTLQIPVPIRLLTVVRIAAVEEVIEEHRAEPMHPGRNRDADLVGAQIQRLIRNVHCRERLAIQLELHFGGFVSGSVLPGKRAQRIEPALRKVKIHAHFGIARIETGVISGETVLSFRLVNVDQLRRGETHRREEIVRVLKGSMRDLLRCSQVFLQEKRRKREDRADVVEAIADIIVGKAVSRMDIDATQVANRIVIFGATSASVASCAPYRDHLQPECWVERQQNFPYARSL